MIKAAAVTASPTAELIGENAFVDSVLLRYHYREGTAQAAFPMRLIAAPSNELISAVPCRLVTTRPVSRANRVILLSIVSVVLLCGIGGAARLGYILYVVNRTTNAPRATAGDFLTDLERGDTGAAYALLCTTAQSGLGVEAFASAVSEHQPLSHHIPWGGSFDERDGTKAIAVTVSATITYADGTTDKYHSIDLRQEAGTWKVCGDPY